MCLTSRKTRLNTAQGEAVLIIQLHHAFIINHQFLSLFVVEHTAAVNTSYLGAVKKADLKLY
jgi:hypothetical protein